MKIVRQNEAELVVQDSSIWLGVVLAVAALLPLYIALSQHDRRLFAPAACLLLFAIPWMRRSTFTFDAATQTIRWSRLRYLWTRTGSLPFSDVRGLETQTSNGSQGVTIYRLALVTPQTTMPMTDVYSSGERQCATVREAIAGFLKLEGGSAPRTMKADLDASVRSLVQEGRRIDAIQLLRTFEKLSLNEATERVEKIAEHA